MPIFIAHPLSIPPAARASRPFYDLEPILPAYPPFPGSSQALVSQSFTYPFQQQPLNAGGSFSEFGYPASPDPFHRTLSTQPEVYHLHPQVQHSQSLPAQSYYAPPPPRSQDPHRGYSPAPLQYIAFDPNTPEMTQSQFLVRPPFIFLYI